MNVAMKLVGKVTRSLVFALEPIIFKATEEFFEEFRKDCEVSARSGPAEPLANKTNAQKNQSTSRLTLMDPVNLRCHDEIAESQAVDLVRPKGNLRLTPSKENVRMVSLLLRNRSDAIHEIQRLFEVWEAVLAVDVVFLGDSPFGNEPAEFGQFLALKRWNAALARNAFLVGKILCHKLFPYELEVAEMPGKFAASIVAGKQD